jgi:Protein of unknown function (DUF3592)
LAENPVRATLAGLLLFVIGVAIAGSTLVSDLREREQRRAWVKADGTIVDIFPGPPGGTPRPVVSFTTPEGERIRFTSTARSGWRVPAVGDAVPVIYPVGLPTEARIDPIGMRRLRTGIAAAAGLLLMALGGYVAWYARRRYAQRASAVE